MAREALPAIPEVDRRTLTALADRFGVPAIDLRQVKLSLAELELVPLEVARTHVVLPIQVNPDAVLLAMHDPTDRRVIDELEFVSNRKVFPYAAHPEQLRAAIEHAYSARARGEQSWTVIESVGNSAPSLPPPPDPSQSVGTRATMAPPPEAEAFAAKPQAIPSSPRDSSAGQKTAPRTPLRAPNATAPSTKHGGGVEIGLDDLSPDSLERDVLHVPSVMGGPSGPGKRRADAMTLGSDSTIGPAPSVPIPPALTKPNALDSVFGPIAGVLGRSVLVVDDEEDIRKLLARVLTERGYRVLEADRGTTALAMVKQHSPDAIVLDAMLPEVHGFEVCRRIKSSSRFGSTPVLMISAVYRGWRFREDLKNSYNVHDFIEKPFRLHDVVAAVDAMLSGKAKPDRDPESMTAEAERAFQRSVEQYKRGQIDEAITLLEQGIQLDPLSYRLHYHLALLVGRKGDLFRAIQELDASLQLNPKSFAVLKNLAVLYQQAGFKRKAIEMWERAVSEAPDDPTRAQIKEHLLSLL
jgi:DNA-binding response OmpR family regulator